MENQDRNKSYQQEQGSTNASQHYNLSDSPYFIQTDGFHKPQSFQQPSQPLYPQYQSQNQMQQPNHVPTSFIPQTQSHPQAQFNQNLYNQPKAPAQHNQYQPGQYVPQQMHTPQNPLNQQQFYQQQQYGQPMQNPQQIMNPNYQPNLQTHPIYQNQPVPQYQPQIYPQQSPIQPLGIPQHQQLQQQMVPQQYGQDFNQGITPVDQQQAQVGLNQQYNNFRTKVFREVLDKHYQQILSPEDQRQYKHVNRIYNWGFLAILSSLPVNFYCSTQISKAPDRGFKFLQRSLFYTTFTSLFFALGLYRYQELTRSLSYKYLTHYSMDQLENYGKVPVIQQLIPTQPFNQVPRQHYDQHLRSGMNPIDLFNPQNLQNLSIHSQGKQNSQSLDSNHDTNESSAAQNSNESKQA